MKTIVIKIGSNVLIKDKTLDISVLKNIVDNVAEFHNQGYRFLIVSSGAVATGKQTIQLVKKVDLSRHEQNQVYASVGQAVLTNTYQQYFTVHKISVAQALLTRRDFIDRDRYISMQKVLGNIVNLGVIPIINENDVLCPEKIDFYDNDQLSAFVSAMVKADYLIILTNVDGLMNDDPAKGGKLIGNVSSINTKIEEMVFNKKSEFGTGGMASKINTAKLMMELGIPMYLANGKKPDVIKTIINNKNIGTLFRSANHKKINDLKIWLKLGAMPVGQIYIAPIIAELLKQGRPASILSIGIEKIVKPFQKGDTVEVCDLNGLSIGVGIARVSSADFYEKQANVIDGKQKSIMVIRTNYFIPVNCYNYD